MISRSSWESPSSFNSRGFRSPLADEEGGDILGAVQYGSANSWDVNKIVYGNIPRRFLPDGEGQHSPVDQVAPVSFSGVFQCDVCLPAKDLLAGSRLFPGGAVTWFDRKYHGGQTGVPGSGS